MEFISGFGRYCHKQYGELLPIHKVSQIVSEKSAMEDNTFYTDISIFEKI
jgi:hypothetical protein